MFCIVSGNFPTQKTSTSKKSLKLLLLIKKQSENSLQLIFLEEIGKPKILKQYKIFPHQTIQESLKKFYTNKFALKIFV